MDLMLEAHGVGPPEQIPVNHDHIASAFEQRIRRQAILLLAIYSRVRRKEIPQVIVPPEREGEDVVNLESPRRLLYSRAWQRVF